jgi:hypothetical protein
MSEEVAVSGPSPEILETILNLRKHLCWICPSLLFDGPISPTVFEEAMAAADAIDAMTRFVTTSDYCSLLIERVDGDTGMYMCSEFSLSHGFFCYALGFACCIK